ncbi:hypothetical protein GCM10009608_08590 [Pseudonocardia alaniniphila]
MPAADRKPLNNRWPCGCGADAGWAGHPRDLPFLRIDDVHHARYEQQASKDLATFVLVSRAWIDLGACYVGIRVWRVRRARAHYMQEPLGQVPAAEVVEAGKQFSSAALENPSPQQPSR